ncbi:hypothetical protein Tco_0843047 [Tanacetum coccineum]|uniref:Uncharacterized protein n=1 Tax=Tanacetum coccineum TaxID=301880 RepID=A0ABQ5B0Y5_9ASTR
MNHNELSNSAKIDSQRNSLAVDLISNEDPTIEDGDNEMGDPTGGSMSLGGIGGIICSISRALIISRYKGSRKPGGISREGDRKRSRNLSGKSPGRKKSQESNSGDGGNTRDGGKIVGEAIGACSGGIGDSLLVALYACMTFIYGSSWIGEMASEAKRSLDRSSEGSEEVFPDEAGE